MKRLIIRPGAIGDCVLALPALQHLRAETTEVWVARQNVPLVRFADGVRAIADTGLDLAGIPDREPPRALFERLRGFDSIVSWYGGNRPEFRAAVAQLPFTFLPALPVGQGDIPGVSAFRFDRRQKAIVCPTSMHAADFFLAQAGGRPPAIPRIECPRAPGGYIVIHPFSGSAKKNWPLERFRELARRLDAPVRWCAGPEEPLAGAERFDDLYELACWLAGARLYIGNDSGITHLAAAAGAPVLALFGPTDPAVWAPRGERVRVLAKMETIGVEEALEAARELL